MRGYLVLHLLGEKVARDLQAEGVDPSSVLAWHESWTNTVTDGMRASPGNSDVTASLLAYRIRARDQLSAGALTDEDE